MHTFHKMLVLTFCVHDFGVLMAQKLVWLLSGHQNGVCVDGMAVAMAVPLSLQC